MGKNKGGGLIEDRVIRNPMEQMRRKQKFKEKEKRREQREFYKEQVRERNEKLAAVDPLRAHDFGMIQSIRQEEARARMGMEPPAPRQSSYTGKQSGVMPMFMPSERRPQVYEAQQAESDQEQASTSSLGWEQLQQNYDQQMSGYQVAFQQAPLPYSNHAPHYKVQPYMKKNQADGQDILSSGAVIYKQKQQQPPVVQEKVQVPQVTKSQPKESHHQKRQRSEPDFNDPLDPSHGEQNFRDKKKKEEETKKKVDIPPQATQFQGVSQDIRKALGLDKVFPQENAETSLPDHQKDIQHQELQQPMISQPRRFLPPALRRQMLAAGGQLPQPTSIPQKPQIGPSLPLQKPMTSEPAQPRPEFSKTTEIHLPNNKEASDKYHQPKPPQAAALTSLLGAYSDSEESDKEEINVPKQLNQEFQLPGSELMFAPLIIEEKEREPKATENSEMDEELRRFMAELQEQ